MHLRETIDETEVDMKRRHLLERAIAGFACIFLVTACEKKEAPAPPPPEVKVAVVLQETVPVYVENIGETVGATDVEIRARVEGFLETIDFQEGSLVKKGQLLYTVDPKPYEAQLATASGHVAEAQASLARAQQDVARYEPLVKLNAISKEQYDTSLSVLEASKAAVEAAKAVAENAKIDLGYTKIYSPIDGLAGKTQVKPGNLVGRGENTLLTVVSDIRNIHVRSNLSERDYLRIARARSGSTTKPKDNCELVLADGSVLPNKGTLLYADRSIDPTTGTLGVEVVFPNPEGIVRPGQYARVRAEIDSKQDAILVPQQAVQELQGTYSVAVVGADNKISLRPVVAGERVGDLWVIDQGLKPGDQIVVEGVQKVRDGMTVTPIVIDIKKDLASAPKEG